MTNFWVRYEDPSGSDYERSEDQCLQEAIEAQEAIFVQTYGDPDPEIEMGVDNINQDNDIEDEF